MPEIFRARDITPQLLEVLNLGYVQEILVHIINTKKKSNRLIVPLVTVDDKTGARIVLANLAAYDPSKVPIIDVMKVKII